MFAFPTTDEYVNDKVIWGDDPPQVVVAYMSEAELAARTRPSYGRSSAPWVEWSRAWTYQDGEAVEVITEEGIYIGAVLEGGIVLS